MNILISKVKWQSAFVHLDDNVAFSKNTNPHMAHLQKVLILLRFAAVKPNLKSCAYIKEKINYLSTSYDGVRGNYQRPHSQLYAN